MKKLAKNERYVVLQGGMSKSDCGDTEIVEVFTNKSKAAKKFNEIKHNQGWNAYYCYTCIEVWTIDEDGRINEYIDTIESHYELQK